MDFSTSSCTVGEHSNCGTWPVDLASATLRAQGNGFVCFRCLPEHLDCATPARWTAKYGGEEVSDTQRLPICVRPWSSGARSTTGSGHTARLPTEHHGSSASHWPVGDVESKQRFPHPHRPGYDGGQLPWGPTRTSKAGERGRHAWRHSLRATFQPSTNPPAVPHTCQN